MNKLVKYSLYSLTTLLYISGCSRGPAVPQSCQPGMYCYKNINFGVSKGSSFERGIRDGCKTGEGDFRKDYGSSSSNKNYENGWILGRSKCKQQLPNEGTIQDEMHSRQRAEYQIQQMKIEQASSDAPTESIVDNLLQSNQDNTDDFEY